MLPTLDRDIQEEADLIRRFVRSCRPRFAAAIELLNRRQAGLDMLDTEMQSLRLCVEAMDMVLVNQDRMATMLRRLCGNTPARLKIA